MMSGHRTIAALALLGVAGCAAAPAPMPADRDIDFVRGCWVQKESPGGQIEAFLRLLPEGDTLAGQLADVATGDWITGATFSFARSGTSASFETRDLVDQPPHTRIDPSALARNFDWARPQWGGELAAYAGPRPSRSFLFVEGVENRLAIRAVQSSLEATLVFTVFDGERDGCD
jgi:hypothetical protein